MSNYTAPVDGVHMHHFRLLAVCLLTVTTLKE